MAQFIDESRIAKLHDTTVSVKSLQNYNNNIKLILKKENRFTSCECEDWKRTMLPFKHMFALFNEKTRLDWDAFSESYRNSPIFSIGIIKNNNIGTNVRGAEFDHSVENEI